MKRWFLSSALLACALAASGGVWPAAGSVARPAAAGDRYELWSVDGLSSNDVWTAGIKVPAGQSEEDSVPLIRHFDGTRWRTVPSYRQGGHLFSIAEISPTDVWAVGDRTTSSGTQVLALHYDGISWKDAGAPTFPGRYNILFNVDAIAPDHVLVSGTYYDDECPCSSIHLVWDGSRWSQGTGTEANLYDVSTLSSTDAWGVGSVDGQQGVAAHWDGTTWSTTHPKSAGRGFRVAAFSDHDVWLTGLNDSGQRYFVQHWDGSAWKVDPDPFTRNEWVEGLSGSGSSDLWAAGYRLDDSLLLEHWDGHAWANVDAGAADLRGRLHDLESISPSDAWAVGDTNLLLHWDGHTWTNYLRTS